MAWTDHFRGALIAIALVAHSIYAVPFTGQLTRTDLREPARKRAVESWTEALNAVGVSTTVDDLTNQVADTTKFVHETHQTLKGPFKPIFQLTNIHQSWALFASATTRPETIVVDIRRAGSDQWETVARRLDDAHPWRAPQLRYRRIRGIWDGLKKNPRPGYRNLVRWLGRRAFEDFEDAEFVRVYMNRGYSTYPWRPEKPQRETRHLWQFHRSTHQAGAL